MGNEASVPLKTSWETVERALKRGNQGIYPPSPVYALVEGSSQGIHSCVQVGGTPVAREHSQAESQVVKVGGIFAIHQWSQGNMGHQQCQLHSLT